MTLTLRETLQKTLIGGCLFVLGGGNASLHAQTIEVSKNNRTIAVTTSADATVEADTAVVHIGFLAYGQDEQAAYANGSRISNSIVPALTAAGVPQEAIESADQSISPVQQYAGQDWSPDEKLERKFQVTQGWTVKVGAKNASRVLDAAVKAGANQSGQIDWTVADENALDAKAAGLALTRARQIAQQMALGLNAGLGPLIYASNEAPTQPIGPLARASGVMGGILSESKSAPLPLNIHAGKVTRSATVYAVFAIQ